MGLAQLTSTPKNASTRLARMPSSIALASRLRESNPAWPILVICLGMPLWWVLGLSQIVFFLVTVPMLIHLLKRTQVLLPAGFGVWALFLVWLVPGVLVLQVDAPGAAAGDSLGRYATYLYRFGWYLIATVAFLYVVNAGKAAVGRYVAQALGALFVVLIVGGYLGLLLPTLEFPSVLEVVLPSALVETGFVNDLVHARSAQVQDFLGSAEARPSAPFAYTNDWGMATALTLPFFIAYAWSLGIKGRFFALIALVLAAVPIIASLNRGLWGAVAVLSVYAVARLVGRGRLASVATVAIFAGVATLLVMSSPLWDLVLRRLATPHSNEARASLGALSVRSAFEGSPFIGFGSTRDILGNFTSIAGGATAACPQCSPPPLGTQGHLWLLIFGAGFVGMALFVGFFLNCLLVHLRPATPLALAAQCSTIAFLVTLPVYDSGGMGVYVALLGLAVLVREDDRAVFYPLSAMFAPVRRRGDSIAALACLGAVAGLGLAVLTGSTARSSQPVLVPATSISAAPNARPLTLDTEALLALSQPVFQAIAAEVDIGEAEAARRFSISAVPNSQILILEYRSEDPDVARRAVEVAATSYLDMRNALAAEAMFERESSLQSRQTKFDESFLEVSQLASGAPGVGPDLPETYTRLRAESFAGARDDVWDRAEPGRVLAPAEVTVSRDRLVVWTASGLALGLLGGLLAAPAFDRVWSRVGDASPSRLNRPFPVLARMSPSEFAVASIQFRGWLGVNGAERPLTSELLIDDRNALVRDIAARARAEFVRGDGVSVPHTFILAGSRSLVSDVTRLYDWSMRQGIHPAGLLLIREESVTESVRSQSQTSLSSAW